MGGVVELVVASSWLKVLSFTMVSRDNVYREMLEADYAASYWKSYGAMFLVRIRWLIGLIALGDIASVAGWLWSNHPAWAWISGVIALGGLLAVFRVNVEKYSKVQLLQHQWVQIRVGLQRVFRKVDATSDGIATAAQRSEFETLERMAAEIEGSYSEMDSDHQLVVWKAWNDVMSAKGHPEDLVPRPRGFLLTRLMLRWA